MPGRRELKFDRLDQVMPEVDRLLAGHETVGKWSLGEICQHLSRTLCEAVEPSIRPMPRLVRALIGGPIFRRVIRSGRMPAGVKSPGVLVPRPGVDARAEAEGLRAAIRLAEERLPETIEHPFFGRIRRADFLRLQCIHCAHHLSFVLPTARPGGPHHVESRTATADGA